MGLIMALRLWLEKDEERELESWLIKAHRIAESFKRIPNIGHIELIKDNIRTRLIIKITIKEKEGLSAKDVVFKLRKGNPSIWINYLGSNNIGIDPSLLREGEEEILVSTISKMLSIN